MPILTPEHIVQISHDLLRAAGAPEGHASIVSEHLASANLSGHDSHGFIRIIQYVREILEEKVIDPAAQPKVLNETSTTCQLDGNSTFGQVVATTALDIGMDKAREHGLSLVTMSNLQHTGRVGSYPEKAAIGGMAAFMCSGFIGGPKLKNVAPFGGTARKLGTNPMVMAFPYKDDAPVLLDFATSISAEGKLRVARAKGELLPDYWVIKEDGTPSNDPNDYYDGGSLLPTGGLLGGHKGYALSFMVGMFGSVLGSIASTTAENVQTTDERTRTGTTLIIIDLERLGSLDLIKSQVDGIVKYVKDTPLREGFSEVLYPGEFEARNRRQRRADGLYIEDATWNEISELMERHGVE